MKTVKFALAAAIMAAPLALSTLPAMAGTAHNIQTGARTSNSADTAETAYQKQVQAYGAPVSGRLLLTEDGVSQ